MPTGLQGGFSRARKEKVSGGGDTPGAHPEFEKPTLLDKAINFVRGMSKKTNSTGNAVTPTTIKDEGITKDPVKLERIARKYVDRK